MATPPIDNGRQHRVFVYGSLKEGQPKEHLLKNKENGEAHFISEAVTVDKWPLVVESQYGIPFLLGRKGRGMPIKGELYLADTNMVAFLDYFEKHPTVYRREEIKVKISNPLKPGYINDQVVSCQTYILYDFSEVMLDWPYYEEYDEKKIALTFDRELETKDFEATMAKLGIGVKK